MRRVLPFLDGGNDQLAVGFFFTICLAMIRDQETCSTNPATRGNAYSSCDAGHVSKLRQCREATEQKLTCHYNPAKAKDIEDFCNRR